MRILVGISGGFDSACAALKLKEEGHEVEGAVLVMHGYTDVEAARRVAESIGIPLHEIDCTKAFADKVISNFVDEYKAARTPNPCIICNPEVKFRRLAEFARKRGFDRIATGHYARLVRYTDCGEERTALARAADKAKDQTYMLYRLPTDILDMLVLPMAEGVKSELRRDAERTVLGRLDAPDSQEICFIPDGDYSSYIEKSGYTAKEGSFIDTRGNLLGTHSGIIRYTVGQRKGLGISLGERMFVIDLDPVANTVTLDTSPKMSDTLTLSGVVCPALARLDGERELELAVKVRYQAPIVPATVTIKPGGKAQVRLTEPQRSVTPGQSAVFYDGDVVIGGGFIERS